MFDPLLWVLHHFVIHYAGQTTQGNTNDGDGVDQASISKDAPKQDTDLPLRADYLSLKRPLQESNTPDQSDASSSADFQLEVVCKGGHGIRKISSPCSQQQSQSQPGSQPSTSHDSPQSDEVLLPVRVGKSEVESYRRGRDIEQYDAFTKTEAMYFKSEYSSKRKLGEGSFGMVYLATRNSNGMEVAYKSIPKSKVDAYALESIPPPRCHLRDSLVGFDEQSVAQCMSSRPPNLLFPYEFALQMYLSRPGRENPYVPKGFDYITLENEYVVVMEYLGGKWVTLSSYLKKKIRLDVSDARDIVKEIVKAMIYLKQQGVVHRDIYGKVKLIDFGKSSILSGCEAGGSFLSKSSDPPSTVSGYKAEDSELETHPLLTSWWSVSKSAGHRIQSGLVPAIQKSRLRLLGRALDLGVENVYTWLRGGVINGESRSGPALVGRDCGA
ncbi:hypothetical protein BASA60_010093 [Batrachochytrium salamandrivorans]|nr:hypothetical protein BASA60_010093 [Batrachochytrium salamandrivorans]